MKHNKEESSIIQSIPTDPQIVQQHIAYLANLLVEGFIAHHEHTNKSKTSGNILPSFDEGTSGGRK
jgi:hypothetical protein